MLETMEETASKETDPYVARFERIEGEAHQPSWMAPFRRAGINRFTELGFPTLRDEDWRFTNVAPIAKLPFKPVFELERTGLTREALARFTFARLPASRLVFVNGHFAAELSSLEPLPPGVTVSSLAAALATDSAAIEAHLSRRAPGEDNAFGALNAAFFQDGAYIHVPDGQTVPAPVHLLFIATAAVTGATWHPRNLIVAGKDSHLTLLERCV